MKFDAIKMGNGNRMLRVGLGQHNGVWFVRLDLWLVGFRISGKEEN
jgi:hypothetical protein